ncbi:MAG TPA: TIGR04211 family SH3 domain-containing protein [Woeseiaceae bacterium]|nr:TIGR04211 family SH3 domain-containing protein [Woeseiaceae bacterium]
MRSITGILLLIALPLAAAADSAYVTDNLQLGLHRAADTSDRAFRTLESGQAVEILERDRYYAHVRLPDGTVGYVKAAYLVEDKPAKLIVAETRAEQERLEQEIATLKQQFAGPAATIGALESQVAEQKATIEKELARVADLLQRNQTYAERAEQYQYSLPMSWVGAALAVCLFAGFMAGWWWLDHRSRKRHGGMRIW